MTLYLWLQGAPKSTEEITNNNNDDISDDIYWFYYGNVEDCILEITENVKCASHISVYQLNFYQQL